MRFRRGVRVVSPLLLAVGALACGFDPESLPDPRSQPRDAAIGDFDAGSAMPLERVSLMLAAAGGDVAVITRLRDEATEIRWSADGPVAMKFAARGGHTDVVRLLASYGLCGDEGNACHDALTEARVNGRREVAAFLESVVTSTSPE